jgi:hypothetical protein
LEKTKEPNTKNEMGYEQSVFSTLFDFAKSHNIIILPKDLGAVSSILISNLKMAMS